MSDTFRESFAMLSGGDHSVAATFYALENDLARKVAHVDTGISADAVCKEFVQDTCSDLKVPLRIMKPPQLQYEDLVLKYGFPGPAHHSIMYRWLKERAIRQLVRESKQNRMDQVGLVSGVYNQESARRMGFTLPRVKVGAQVWLAPLYNWNPIMFDQYKRKHSLPTSPVKATLGFSGECLCGAFATPNEIVRIEKFYPATAAKIHDLERKAKAAGKHCVWGVRPKRTTAQYEIPFRPMCSSCPTKDTNG
jgi:3'-phosphoadenosine 5'-phosphosulfate sulfotransferase (PAPS reductase)/FAD synthetase